MRRALLILAWLCVGHALAGLIYVGLLYVPEANVAMLALSALAALAVIAVVGVVDVTTLLWLMPGVRFRPALGRAARWGTVAVVLGAAVFLAVDGAGAWLEARHASKAGEIDAWLIATFGLSRTAWLHRTLAALLFALRNIVGVSLAVAMLSAVALRGWRGALSPRWVGAACSRFQLGLVALAILLLVFLPWRAVGWRPNGLPPTWIEPAFVGLKLGVVYVMAHIGWMLVLFAGGRAAQAPLSRRQGRAREGSA